MFLGLAIVASLVLLGSTLSPPQPASASHAKDVTVLVGEFWFCDPDFENGVCKTDIREGATVTWDFTPTGAFQSHTTTECGGDCDFPTATPLWDSGLQFQGDTFAFTFDTPGSYLYYCTVHPFSMRGVINVGPVGGAAEIDTADMARTGIEAESRSSGIATTIAAGTAATLIVALGGAAWYTRRRLA